EGHVVGVEMGAIESLLVFHAGGVTVKVNKASDTDGNPATVAAKLDWSTLSTTGLSLPVLDISKDQDLHADGNVALNALNGVLVAAGNFNLDLGQVSTVTADNGVSFSNANAVAVTLNNVGVFVGSGGSLSDNTSTATVVNGSLGFGGTVTSLKVVSIRDTNGTPLVTTDDKNYLGVESTGLTADLVGLESVLVFHAGGVTVKVNKASPAAQAKLDWDSLSTTGTTGLPLASLDIDKAVDLHADGNVVLNALSGVLVASGSFN